MEIANTRELHKVFRNSFHVVCFWLADKGRNPSMEQITPQMEEEISVWPIKAGLAIGTLVTEWDLVALASALCCMKSQYHYKNTKLNENSSRYLGII